MKETWMLSLFLLLCLEELARLIFGPWQCLQLWRFFIHRESKWCLPKTVCRLMLLPKQHQLKTFFCCSRNECLYLLPVLCIESEIISEMICMYHDWITTFTAWEECRGRFSLAIINSSQIQKKATSRWDAISNITIKHKDTCRISMGCSCLWKYS